MSRMKNSRWIALSEEVYAALLILYPADYRHEYSWLMRQVFRDVSRERYQKQGWMGVVFWWCRTILDLTITVIQERRRMRIMLTKATFIQFAGVLLALGRRVQRSSGIQPVSAR